MLATASWKPLEGDIAEFNMVEKTLPFGFWRGRCSQNKKLANLSNENCSKSKIVINAHSNEEICMKQQP